MRQQTETREEIQVILDSWDEAGDINDPLPQPEPGAEPGTPTPTKADNATQADNQSGSLTLPAAHQQLHHLELNHNTILVKQFWRQFTIKDAVTHMLKVWDDINVATIRRSWKIIAPSFVQDVIDSEAQDLRDSVARAVEVAREVPCFQSVTEDEVLAINSEGDTQSVIGIVAGLVIEDELAQAQEQPIMEENVESEYSGHTLSLILASAENLKQVFIENEKSKMKKAEFVLQIDAALRYYKELHQGMINKRKQTIITRYICPATSTTTDVTDLPDFPLPGPSGEPRAGPSGEPGPSEIIIDEFTVFMRDVHAFRRSSRAINILTGHAPVDGEDTNSK